MGRLTRDPETRFTQNKNTVANFTIAVNRRLQEGTDFFNIIAWNKTGEFASKYFKKGQQVGVIGRLQNREYEGKDGTKKRVTEVIAEEVYFADSKRDNSNINDIKNMFEPNFNINEIEYDPDLPF